MIRFETPYLPADVDYNQDRLRVLENHFQRMMDADELLSANYCLSREGKIFANAAMGKLSYKEEDERQLQPDTIQRIASITKLFCAVSIFKLAEDGMLRINQTVGEFIDEFKEPPFNNITIAHLLSHTSGMVADDGCFENKYFRSPWSFINQAKEDNWIEAALSSGMRREPGEEWAYCSFGFVILGEIVSRVSGVFVHDYIIENIVMPCGMEDTSFMPSKEQALRVNIRSKYMEDRIKAYIRGEEGEKSIWDKVPSTGGGMWSTALDLNKFGIMLLNNGSYEGKRILGRKTVEKMTTMYLTGHIKDYCWNTGGTPRLYGLGPDFRHNESTFYSFGSYFHEGAGACCLTIDPIEKLVASWFVPFAQDDVWHAHALFNASAIIWSGLK
ncbi:MAG TPA: serine hydrolase domain-containing protein [Bacillota bacterium]|nr:serine hydrolase domain-containing protein [Bacillota bacterium]